MEAEDEKMAIETKTLNNGVNIPLVGFGTWLIYKKDEVDVAVKAALSFGYRHIDTAAAYHNENYVGKAIAESGIKRSDLFITSKVPAEIKGYDKCKKAFEASIKALGVDFLDLYLIHAPRPWNEMGSDKGYRYDKENVATYLAMEDLLKEGKIKAIGVSNFDKKDIENLLKNCHVVPAVNQVEYHPGYRREDIQKYCEGKGIAIEAYSPFAHGRVFANQTLIDLAAKYKVGVAELCLKWCLKRGTIALPKSKDPERIKKNLELGFDISEPDMEAIDKVDVAGFH
jgi:diketogulonate reductase-like aldo/keto reductase